MTEAAAVIELKGIDKSYGVHRVLKQITFAVNKGESFAIIGPNGAGKTTMFKVLTGEIFANSGSVQFRGVDVTNLPAYDRVRIGFGRTFQVARVFLHFTVLENIIVAVESRMRGQGVKVGPWYAFRPSRTVLEEAAFRMADIGLSGKRFVEARNLSHGDKKRLELGLALALNPDVLMLDEPTAGMSPADRHAIVELIQRIRAEQGISVMLTEHDMDVVFGLADRILVLNYGEVIVIGPPQEVRANPMVAEIYLGKEMVGA
jgi:branched-chain amino acid transport system ATP-binding protein